MFSTTPITSWPVCRDSVPARSATSTAACCGVETSSRRAVGSSCAIEIAMSPVPGGRSSSSTSRSPKCTSVRNCSSARCSIGPRQAMGRLPSTNIPMEITRTDPALGSSRVRWGTSTTGGRIMSSSLVGAWVIPSSPGTEKPCTSASTMPTERPWEARAAARLTVTVDLPTPPLPEATA
ncbi:Uncharacterised protein [Mycobacteroides abscessus subsp. abscessus]|nr:Uncharacterised protein [Mycobacteroides abscessus subsp. abscessus]